MAEMEIIETASSGETGFSRRNFIKGVIATGAAVSSSSYVLRDGGEAIAQSAERERSDSTGRCDQARNTGRDPSIQARSDGDKNRLRPRRVWQLYSTS